MYIRLKGQEEFKPSGEMTIDPVAKQKSTTKIPSRCAAHTAESVNTITREIKTCAPYCPLPGTSYVSRGGGVDLAPAVGNKAEGPE